MNIYQILAYTQPRLSESFYGVVSINFYSNLWNRPQLFTLDKWEYEATLRLSN